MYDDCLVWSLLIHTQHTYTYTVYYVYMYILYMLYRAHWSMYTLYNLCMYTCYILVPIVPCTFQILPISSIFRIIYMVWPCTKHACVVYNCCELILAENLNIKYVHMYIHIALSLSYRANNSIHVGLHKWHACIYGYICMVMPFNLYQSIHMILYIA